MNQEWSLKRLAGMGYGCGLNTIGEVASMVRNHYDAFFLIDNLQAEMEPFYAVVKGHEDDSIDLYITAEDKAEIDKGIEAALGNEEAV